MENDDNDLFRDDEQESANEDEEEVEMDDDASDHEMTTDQLRAHLRQLATETIQKIPPEYAEDKDIELSAVDLISLCVHFDLGKRFLDRISLCRRQGIIFRFSDLGRDDDTDIATETLEAGLLETDAISAFMEKMGRRLKEKGGIDRLIFVCFPSFCWPFAGKLMSQLYKFKALDISFRRDAALDDLRALAAPLWNHALLEHVSFCFPNAITYRTLMPVMASLPNLSSFVLEGGRFLPLISIDDSDLLRQLMMKPTITQVELSMIKVGSVAGAQVFCDALLSSSCKKFLAIHMNIVAEAEAMVAEAFAMSNVEDLYYAPSEGGTAYVDQFGRSLGGSTKLHTLDVHLNHQSSNALSKFLRGSHNWKVRSLCLRCSAMNDHGLSKLVDYIRQNSALRKLTIHLTGKYPASLSSCLMNAVDSGTRCLEEVDLSGPDSWTMQNLVDQLRPVLALNRQRHLVQPWIDKLQHIESMFLRRLLLLRIVDAVDEETLFEFLRRNEFMSQDLVRQCSVSPSKASNQRGRKRTADEQ